MKGITPIISIIILLLITIGLASAAWTYMSGYFQGLTSKVLEMSSASCIGGTQVSFLAGNIGTSNISTASIQILDLDTGSNVVTTWKDLSNAVISSIAPGQSARAFLGGAANCTTAGVSKSCRYEMTITSTTFKQIIPVTCPG